MRRALDDAGADVSHLRAPNDRDIRRALTPDVDAVVVISRDDRVSLWLALVVEGVRPGVRLIVTIYNRDLAAQLRRAVRNVRVTSMAEIVAPALAGPCLAEDLIAITSDEIENISTAVAGLSVREDLPTVLRAGSGDVMDETRALFRIGRRARRLPHRRHAARRDGAGPGGHRGLSCDEAIYITRPDGAVEPFAAHARGLRVS